MKAKINLSSFCSLKFLTCSIRQISSDFSTVKVLHYTVTNSTVNKPMASDYMTVGAYSRNINKRLARKLIWLLVLCDNHNNRDNRI